MPHNNHHPAAESELDALMTRVRDAVAERRDRGVAPSAPPISLDGVLRSQTELNDAVARAITTFAAQIAELRNRPVPLPLVKPKAAEPPQVTREQLEALAARIDLLEQTPPPDLSSLDRTQAQVTALLHRLDCEHLDAAEADRQQE